MEVSTCIRDRYLHERYLLVYVVDISVSPDLDSELLSAIIRGSHLMLCLNRCIEMTYMSSLSSVGLVIIIETWIKTNYVYMPTTNTE